jgi:uncharacterized protein YheU (UPF0270 family)
MPFQDTESADDRPPPVPIPVSALSVDALQGVVESFVLREGTDYGEREVSFASKCDHVLLQLRRGEIHIVWDPVSESVQLLSRDALGRGGLRA